LSEESCSSDAILSKTICSPMRKNDYKKISFKPFSTVRIEHIFGNDERKFLE
jgi:hypothetical protein